MSKALYIAEKPSVAQEFAKALKINGQRRDGYLESQDSVVTWCVGHLVTMSYPEKYDIKYKRWSLDTLPFLPREFKYEVIPGVQKQFEIVKGLLNREDVDTIYVCTDSGREGEYIYRLVAQMAGVHGKKEKRVWIDSQTEEEIMLIRSPEDLEKFKEIYEINITHHQYANAGDVSGAHGFYTTTNTMYYVTFQMESGDRMEFQVSGIEYGMLAEGDTGELTFQGTRYLAFER